MKRNASAVWQGGLTDGKGRLTTNSGVLSDTQYSFSTRFEEGAGTNPEELIAAAHAGCFSMALSMMLGEVDIKPEQIDTTATVNLEKDEGGFSITAVHLEVSVQAPGATQEAFSTAAEKAKAGCPVSRVLNAKITMNAKLTS
ncbi:MAG: OsmC family protein [Desulfobacterales bacterium]